MFSESLVFRKSRQSIKFLYNSFLDFLYPPFCYTCDERLNEKEELVCERCWSSFRFYEGGIRIEKKDLMLGAKRNFSDCYAMYYFDDKTLKLIHFFKYYRKSSLSSRIGKDLGEIIKNNNFEKTFDMIISVPLHKTKERERGFNQSCLISEYASSISGLPLSDNIVIRKKNNKSQSQLTYKERIENVRDIFEVKYPEKINGKRIILIDDVITTGLTVNSCCGELKKHRAGEIFCLCVIHPVEK